MNCAAVLEITTEDIKVYLLGSGVGLHVGSDKNRIRTRPPAI
jgi:hypothetical protein